MPPKAIFLRATAGIALLAFGFNLIGPWPSYANELILPAPGAMVHLSPAYNPPILKGVKVHAENPFQFDFILDKGDPVKSPKGDHGAGSSQAVAMTQRNKANEEQELKQEANKLIKYFLASITVSEKDLWVNLSPYEKDRIIPQSFGLTEMGRDLLAQDYMLKQITASLIYPEDEIGRKFWKRIYEEAAKRYGTTNIPVNTFNKVWIVPDKAVVYENMNLAKLTRGHVPLSRDVYPSRLPSEKGLNVKVPPSDGIPPKAVTSQGNPPTNNEAVAYVVESKLKVMLEQDYVALSKQRDSAESRVTTRDVALSHQRDRAKSRATTRDLAFSKDNVMPVKTADRLPVGGIQELDSRFRGNDNNKESNDTSKLGSEIIREIVIPALQKEINEGANFAQLRQVYSSLILATWYKKKIKDSILAKVYVDKNKIAGIGYQDTIEAQNPKIETNSKDQMIKTPKRLGHSDLEHLSFVSGLGFRVSNLNPQQIYDKYLKAFKRGVYSYIKEEMDPAIQQPISRKYFSGGVNFSRDTSMIGLADMMQQATALQAKMAVNGLGADGAMKVTVDTTPFLPPRGEVKMQAQVKKKDDNSMQAQPKLEYSPFELAEALKVHFPFRNDLIDRIKNVKEWTDGNNGKRFLNADDGQRLVEVSQGICRFFDEKGRWILELDPFGHPTVIIVWTDQGKIQEIRYLALSGEEIRVINNPGNGVDVVYARTEKTIYRYLSSFQIDFIQKGSIPGGILVGMKDDVLQKAVSGYGLMLINIMARIAEYQGLKLKYENRDKPLKYFYYILREVVMPDDSLKTLYSFLEKVFNVQYVPKPIDLIINPSGVSIAIDPKSQRPVRAFYQGRQYIALDRNLDITGPKDGVVISEDAVKWSIFDNGKWLCDFDRWGNIIKDQQMQAQPSNTGGIDLTSLAASRRPGQAGNALQVKTGGQGEIAFKIDEAQMAQLQNVPGFYPKIILMEDLNNLQEFLGLAPGQ